MELVTVVHLELLVQLLVAHATAGCQHLHGIDLHRPGRSVHLHLGTALWTAPAVGQFVSPLIASSAIPFKLEGKGFLALLALRLLLALHLADALGLVLALALAFLPTLAFALDRVDLHGIVGRVGEACAREGDRAVDEVHHGSAQVEVSGTIAWVAAVDAGTDRVRRPHEHRGDLVIVIEALAALLLVALRAKLPIDEARLKVSTLDLGPAGFQERHQHRLMPTGDNTLVRPLQLEPQLEAVGNLGRHRFLSGLALQQLHQHVVKHFALSLRRLVHVHRLGRISKQFAS